MIVIHLVEHPIVLLCDANLRHHNIPVHVSYDQMKYIYRYKHSVIIKSSLCVLNQSKELISKQTGRFGLNA